MARLVLLRGALGQDPVRLCRGRPIVIAIQCRLRADHAHPDSAGENAAGDGKPQRPVVTQALDGSVRSQARQIE